MNAALHFRYSSQADRRWRATFVAWTILIAFAAIAVTSFTVDQTITMSSVIGSERESLYRYGMGGTCAEFGPAGLIQSLIDAVLDRPHCTK